MPTVAQSHLTLHAAMAAILVEMGGRWLDRDELAALIAEHDLYRRPKDGKPPPSYQLRLRARRYPQLFEGDDSQWSRIRLRLADPAPWSARHNAEADCQDTPIADIRQRAEPDVMPSPRRTILIGSTMRRLVDRIGTYADRSTARPASPSPSLQVATDGLWCQDR
jgi:hypothetical protein